VIPLLLLLPYALDAQAPDQQEVIKQLANFGVALGGVTLKATREGILQRQQSSDPSTKSHLDTIIHNYTFSRDMNRGGVALLDTNFEVVFTGIDVVTEGASLVATVPLRFAKNKALDAMSDKIQEEASHALASDISHFITDQHLDYDSFVALAREHPEQAKASLDSIQAVQELKSQVGGDSAAKDVIDRAVIGTILTTQKADLEAIAANSADTAANKEALVKLGQSFNDYKNTVDSALKGFEDQIDGIQNAVSAAQVSISNLTVQTQNNSVQLSAIGDVLFSQSSAQDRLALLRAGFKKNELTDPNAPNPTQKYDELVRATEADAKRELVEAQMKDIVVKFGQVTTIADRVGIHIDGLDEAAAFASTANNVINDVMSGDFLGAVVGVTGLFGHGPDPEAIFRQQLMKYLDANFKQVNEKLDTIIQGQQQIMAALSQLSDQLATYDKAVHSQLDRIEFKLDTIQALALQQFYLPFGFCAAVEQNVRNALMAGGFVQANLRSFDQMKFLLTPAGETFDAVHGCIEFLDVIFKLSSDPTPFHFTPLAVRYSTTHSDPTFVVDPQQVHDYTTATETFIDGQYRPTADFFLAQLTTPLTALGLSSGFNKARALGAAAIPADNVRSLIAKLQLFSQPHNSCTSDTLLNDSLIGLLCSQPQHPATFLTLSSEVQIQQENSAEDKALTNIQSPLMFDALEQVSTWAEFFAPVWDYADEAHTLFFTNAADFLAQPVILPKGLGLVRGALRLDSIAIAQMNMLYGDHLAAMVFNTLWSENNGLPSMASTLAGAPQKATSLLASGNPFLARNVLMIALDKARVGQVAGRDLSYMFALDYLLTAKADSDAQLKALFGNKVTFKIAWRATDLSVPDGDANCAAEPDSSEKRKSCTPVPTATIAGVDVPMPSVDQFSHRTLVYPNSMLRIIGKRDSLAAMAAEYEALDYAKARENANKTDLEKSFLGVLN
jgi:hypothetical protein